MKKSSKLLAALLTGAMVSSMAALPAYADTIPENGILENVNDGILEFTKILHDSGTIPDTTIEFTMTPVEQKDIKDDDVNGLTVRPGKELEDDTFEMFFDSDSDTEQTGEFDLNDLANGETFNEIGIYRYEVREVEPEEEETPEGENTVINMTYDDTIYVVDVYVNADHKITSIVSTDKKKGEKKPIEFNNYALTDELVITKTVTGTYAEKDKEFQFYIDIPVEGTNLDLAEGTKIIGKIEHADKSTPTDVAFYVGDENGFKLKDGDRLTISDLPEGMIYTVTEANYEDYDCSIAYEYGAVDGAVYGINTDGVEGPEYKGTIYDGKNEVDYTNTRIDISATGIVLNVAPYIVVFVLAAAGVVVLFARKRRIAR